ncbi:MAG: roadblock/LC7 domain-containing protein [Candidatus Rokuibacteriota bacterium]
MTAHDIVIHEADAATIAAALSSFLGDAGATAALLIDRSGQPLVTAGPSRTLDTASIAALAAGAFSSTGALARLLGETEFSVLFHQGVKENMHVSTVDEQAILLVIFNDQTTVGMVRLFARETTRAVAAILAAARTRPRKTGGLAVPMTADEIRPAFRGRPA